MEGKSSKNTTSSKASATLDKTQERRKGWYVIADTHLGLAPNRDDVQLSEEMCDPEPLGKFMLWLIDFQNSGKPVSINVYDPREDPKSVELQPPEKLIMLGDMYDLWDSTDWEAEFCGRDFFKSVNMLNCDKIYIIGNHDISMRTLVGTYPSDRGKMRILDKPYYVGPPKQKQGGIAGKSRNENEKQRKTSSKYLFTHGQEFEASYRFNLWKHVDILRLGAQALGDYWNLLIFLAVLGLPLYLGLNFGVWLSVFLLTLLYECYSQRSVVYSWLLLLPMFLWTPIGGAYLSSNFAGILGGIILEVIALVALVFALRGTKAPYLLSRRRRDYLFMLYYSSVYVLSTIVLPIELFLSPDLDAFITQYLYPICSLAILFMFLGAAVEHFSEKGKKFRLAPQLLIFFTVIFEAVPMQWLEQLFWLLNPILQGFQQLLYNDILRGDAFGFLFSKLMFAICLILVLPRIIYKCGIHIIRSLGSIRYAYFTPIKEISGWLYPFREKKIEERFFVDGGEAPEKDALDGLTLVYGHTHRIGVWRGDIRRREPAGQDLCLNVPSWVKDETKGEKIKHEIRNAFLYISPDSAEEPCLFLAFDWEKTRPFQIPWATVEQRRDGKLGYLQTETSEKLLRIGWPPLMIAEWIGWRHCIASGEEISKQVLFEKAKVNFSERISEEQQDEMHRQIAMTSCCWKLAYKKYIKNRSACPYCERDLSSFKPYDDWKIWKDKIDEWLNFYDAYNP